MKIIIIGCGRNGAELAQDLSRRGHAVVVVDKDPGAFERLGPAYRGRMLTGVGFDREVLRSAGVERADGLAVVTASDEANIVIALLARQIFHVPRVVARVYDPAMAEIYRRLGLQIISPVALATHRLAELLCYSTLEPVVSLGNGDIDIVTADAPQLLAGRQVQELTAAGEVQVVALSRDGKTILPSANSRIEAGDVLHVAVHRAGLDRLKSMLDGVR